ncbi:MAG: hypothetical protein ACK5CA_08485 [Cyanobacteriota bacterium]
MQTLQTPPITSPRAEITNVPVPTAPPPFSGNDPFWIIVALAILVRAILGNSDNRKSGGRSKQR